MAKQQNLQKVLNLHYKESNKMTKVKTTNSTVPTPKIYSRFNLPPKVRQSFLDKDGNPKPGRTKQSFKEEADINNIVKKHGRAAIQQQAALSIKQYGDYTEINEYQESLDLINTSNENFNKLPADVRKEFNNNAGEFLEFATNPDNAEKMYDLGIAKRPIEEPKSEPIEVINVTPENKEETPK